VSGLNR